MRFFRPDNTKGQDMSRFTRRFMIATLLALLVTAPVSAQVIPVEIWEIQGAGHRSPLLGMDILTQNNIVTAVAGNGFYIQTPQHLLLVLEMYHFVNMNC